VRAVRTRDAMSTPAVFVRPQLPVEVAAAVLVAHGFSAAPVVDDDGHLVGIVTEADLLRGPIVPAQADRAEVRSVMHPDPITADPDDDLADVVATMLDAGIRSVPVVHEGRVVGVVSQRDVLRTVARAGATPRDWRRGIRVERHNPDVEVRRSHDARTRAEAPDDLDAVSRGDRR
jgi:CBS domain-containing protein